MNRSLVIVFLAALIFLGSLVTLGATVQERDFELRGYVDASLDSNLPFRVPRFGVNVELEQYDDARLRRHLGWMQQAHVTWLRQIVRWDELEPHPDEYNWGPWDKITAAVAEFPQLRLVAVLVNSPDWAREQGDLTAPPQDPARFAAFASAFADRYSNIVDHYQIWDEPNLASAWGGLEPRPADYLALLSAAYQAIHDSDPHATVLSAALAPTTETGGQNISDLLYLRDLYALGANEYMDAAAGKPFGFSIHPLDRQVRTDTLSFSRAVALREVMLDFNQGKQALWAANWGWNALPGDWTGEASIWGQVTADERVHYTLTALDRADREWPWLGGLILQHWQPDAPPDDPQWGFAVIASDDTPTPLWHALVNRPQPLAAENGLFPAVNPYATYSGVWTFGPLGADIGWVQDSQFAFRFRGRDISLLLRQDNYTAYLYPSIDGEPANAIPRDSSGNAYVVLTSGGNLPEINLVPIARDLVQTEHTLRAVADRGWDRWALAGFGVSSGSLAAEYSRLIDALVLSTSVAGAAFFITFVNLLRLHFARIIAVAGRLFGSIARFPIAAVSSVLLLVGMLLTWGDVTPTIFRRDAVPLSIAIATAGLIKLEPGIVITIAAALLLFIICFHRPDIGLTLVVFWSPFFLFPVELYRFAFPLAELVMLITFAAWLLRQLVEWARQRGETRQQIPLGDRLRQLQMLDWAVLAWVVLGCAAFLWSERRGEALTELRMLFIEPAIFYLIFRSTRLSRGQVVRIVDALLLAGLFVAVIGLWQFIQGQAIITAEAGARRLASVYGSPNNVALLLGRSIPFALAYLLLLVGSFRRISAALWFVPVTLALLLTQSVGALFLGVPAAIVTVFALTYRRRAFLPIAAMVVISVLAFIGALQIPRFARVLDFTEGTNFYRLRVWESAVNIIRDHPLTGLGLDQFLYAFRGHYILPDAWQEPNLSHPHNIVLDFWVRLGVIGVAVLFSMMVLFLRRMLLSYNRHIKARSLYLALLIGAMGAMMNLLAHGLVDNSVYVQDLAYIFVLLLGLAAHASNTRSIDEPL
ncbi:MAG: O-antigen ligase family protein [Anaerolineae bacterium]|nr:O-antigen ligase family protein [Anaerolineae bacterium]